MLWLQVTENPNKSGFSNKASCFSPITRSLEVEYIPGWIIQLLNQALRDSGPFCPLSRFIYSSKLAPLTSGGKSRNLLQHSERSIAEIIAQIKERPSYLITDKGVGICNFFIKQDPFSWS